MNIKETDSYIIITRCWVEFNEVWGYGNYNSPYAFHFLSYVATSSLEMPLNKGEERIKQ